MLPVRVVGQVSEVRVWVSAWRRFVERPLMKEEADWSVLASCEMGQLLLGYAGAGCAYGEDFESAAPASRFVDVRDVDVDVHRRC